MIITALPPVSPFSSFSSVEEFEAGGSGTYKQLGSVCRHISLEGVAIRHVARWQDADGTHRFHA